MGYGRVLKRLFFSAGPIGKNSLLPTESESESGLASWRKHTGSEQ